METVQQVITYAPNGIFWSHLRWQLWELCNNLENVFNIPSVQKENVQLTLKQHDLNSLNSSTVWGWLNLTEKSAYTEGQL